MKAKLALSDLTYSCEHRGVVVDRNENAACSLTYLGPSLTDQPRTKTPAR